MRNARLTRAKTTCLRLSLDDVMSDRPWTADELMGGGARPTSPKPTSRSAGPRPRRHPCPQTTLPPVPSCRHRVRPPLRPAPPAIRPRRRRFSLQRHSAMRQTARFAYAAPQQSTYAAPEPQPNPARAARYGSGRPRQPSVCLRFLGSGRSGRDLGRHAGAQHSGQPAVCSSTSATPTTTNSSAR